MIFDQITPADYISLYGLAFITTLFFLIFGIMVLATKNTNLIAKDTRFYNEKAFVKLYGWINVIGSFVMTILLVIALVFVELNITIFIILTVVVLSMIVLQSLLVKKYRIEVKK